jgi:hypothetical protein
MVLRINLADGMAGMRYGYWFSKGTLKTNYEQSKAIWRVDG